MIHWSSLIENDTADCHVSKVSTISKPTNHLIKFIRSARYLGTIPIRRVRRVRALTKSRWRLRDVGVKRKREREDGTECALVVRVCDVLRPRRDCFRSRQPDGMTRRNRKLPSWLSLYSGIPRTEARLLLRSGAIKGIRGRIICRPYRWYFRSRLRAIIYAARFRGRIPRFWFNLREETDEKHADRKFA